MYRGRYIAGVKSAALCFSRRIENIERHWRLPGRESGWNTEQSKQKGENRGKESKVIIKLNNVYIYRLEKEKVSFKRQKNGSRDHNREIRYWWQRRNKHLYLIACGAKEGTDVSVA